MSPSKKRGTIRATLWAAKLGVEDDVLPRSQGSEVPWVHIRVTESMGQNMIIHTFSKY